MPIIILDKSYLRSKSQELIKNDLQGHQPIVTTELLYEIKTCGQGISSKTYLHKLRGLDVLLARPVGSLVRDELQTSSPSASIVDELHTNALKTTIDGGRVIIADAAILDQVRRWHEQEEPTKIRNSIERMWSPDLDDIFLAASKSIKSGASVPAAYLHLFQENLTLLGQALQSTYELSKKPDSDWIVHAWAWIRNFVAFKYRIQGNKPNQLTSGHTLANDLLDLHYLAILAKADGIATCEVGDSHMSGIARHFYPNKIVVS